MLGQWVGTTMNTGLGGVRVMSRARARLAVVAITAAAVGLTAAPAIASASLPAARAQHAAVQPRVSIAITSVRPAIAVPGSTVTVSGVATNPTAQAVHSPAVQLWSSSSYLENRTDMMRYLTLPGPTGMDAQVPGAVSAAVSVPAHSVWRWSIRLSTRQVHMRAVGVSPLVYPLAAELSQSGQPLDADRTFLPFWPGKAAAGALKPVRIAWVWPLIDVPQRAACESLLSNELAASVAAGGRLNQLLQAGRSPAGRRARLTWAIDPALLSDVSVMTAPYRVGASGTCAGATSEPASGAAKAWLAGVREAAATQGFFITPYADVDVAALSHRGLKLASAFSAGRLTALKLLGPGGATAGDTFGETAWPPHGAADYGVLEGLAANHVRTVILDSSLMPPVTPATYTPSAVARTSNGLGGKLHVLLADSTMSQILATPSAEIPGVVPAPSPWSRPGRGGGSAGLAAAAVFAKEQWFLAETAMIAAEAPAIPRALVITPPRRWNPPAGMASALLAETDHAPWLRPASLASLVRHRSMLSRLPLRPPPWHKVSGTELPFSLLTRVKSLSGHISLLVNILNGSEQDLLNKAVATIESSAWGGGKAGQREAVRLLDRVSSYVMTQIGQVQIVDPVHVTLGGNSGAVPVSVRNKLSRPITVRLQVSTPSPGRIVIGRFHDVITFEGRQLRTIKIPVRAAAAGSTTLTLRLATVAGTPLPGSATTLTVEATHFGTLAIVIILIALVVFVLTAAARAIRRGPDPAAEGPVQPGEGGVVRDGEEGEEGATPAHSPASGAGADSVVPRGQESPARQRR